DRRSQGQGAGRAAAPGWIRRGPRLRRQSGQAPEAGEQALRGGGCHSGRGRVGEGRRQSARSRQRRADGGAAGRTRGAPRPVPVGAPMAEFLVVGINHRSGTAALREALYVDEERQPELLDRMKAAGLAGAVFLSTCDRSEVQAVTADAEAAAAAVGAAFAGQAGVPAEEVAAQSYRLTGGEALRHIFAVAASLDSQVIGEPQVLGQVKEAHRLSVSAGLMVGGIDEALQAA